MFTRWGDLVYRLRFAVIGVVVAALLGLGGYGLGLEDHLSSSGWDDPTSESAKAARIADGAFGRDHTSDVIVLYTAPEGKTIDDPQFRQQVVDSLNKLPREFPNEIAKVNGAYWQTETGPGVPLTFGSKDKRYTFASLAIVGDNDTDMVRNYRKVKDAFFIPGVDVQVTGLQAVSGTLNDTIASDSKRMEMLAIPAVAILLFFIFGGVVAAALPLMIGGLTIIGANGIVMFLTRFTEVNSFVGGVVSMIGLGLAIDYGLFIVSRFREEVAEGYDTPAAVRRTVMTAGRTVVFSATMIIASLGGILLFPQGFLKSVAFGTIATVSLAALTSITILPAALAILGPRVDALGLKRFRKTKTAEEIENGIWGRSTQWVMKHPLKIAVPICVLLLLLIIPVKNLAFGGINERYLPPDNPTRTALEEFYQIFPLKKTDPVQLVFVSEDSGSVGTLWKQANEAPGLTGNFEVPSRSNTYQTVYRTSATLEDSENAEPTIDYLRSLEIPDGVQMYVGGQPTIQKDSIDALLDRMPLMIALVLLVTTVLMFLTFGSLVLPIKAALMSALGLGSTLGILTWIFVDGHGAKLLNFTPQPIMSPVLVLIIAVIYGLSTDYEVFLLSRMVEARAQGASTTEAVRIGTAQTGRIITAAALILLVVVGAFAFSDLVMMQYIAYGLIAALFIDATILRMLLVPATMKLLGDDCWWAPAWMKRIQERVGLGEVTLENERPGGGEVVDLVKTTPVTDPVTMQMPAVDGGKLRRSPRRPRTVEEIEAEAPTARIGSLGRSASRANQTKTSAESAPPRPAPAEPTRPRATPMRSPADPTRPRAVPPTASGAEAGRTGAGSHPLSPALPPTEPAPAVSRPAPRDHGVLGDIRNGGSTPPDALRADTSATGRDATPASAEPARGVLPGEMPFGLPGGSDDRRGESAGSFRGFAEPPRTVGDGGADFSRTPPAVDRPRTAPAGDADPGRTAPAPNAESPRNAPSENTASPADRFSPGGDSGAGFPRADVGSGFSRRDDAAIGDPGTAGTPGESHGVTGFGGVRGPENGATPRESGPTREADHAPEASTPAAEPHRPTHHAQSPDVEETPEENRSSIENWMAELRSSRRRVETGDEGRHSGNDGRTVSVNELLRRRDHE
ncbi:MMPL family transporter [Nocardia takedensis]|uniref:MMPL family transporter n=1 Tax=Nocardia takedensis TaxID=259390 RepID=UPI0002EAF927|nr:MMPL family transporter [Nocardia takedensis]